MSSQFHNIISSPSPIPSSISSSHHPIPALPPLPNCTHSTFSMAGKKKKSKGKGKSKSKSEMEARIETEVVTSEAIPYQAFKDLSPGGITPLKKIAIQMDNTGEESVLWKDIQRVFPNVLHVKDGDTDVPFLTNDKSEDLLPLRIPHLPGVVLGVVSKVSEGTEPDDIPMPPLESLSLEIDTIKKPCRHDPRGRDRHTLTNAQRLQKETEAMLTLRRYAYASGRIDSLSGAPLEALTTLVYSDKLHFQKIAVLAFPPSVVKGGGSVKREVMEPILYLLRSDDIAVHEPALYALAKLVYQDERNCRLAIELEALVDVNRLLRATTPKVHWVALAVVHEIIRMESFRIEVAKSGVIEALIPLALSRDARVPRTLAGTFLEFSHTDETRQMIVEAGAVPLLFCLLDSLVPDIQLVSAQAIEGITVDSRYLRMIAEAREGLEFTLIGFLDLSNPLLAPVAAMTLARLSLDQDFRIKILQSQVLLPLFQMMRSDYYQLIETSMLCFATLSTDLSIGSTGIEARLADRIVELVSYKGNEDLQFNSVVTLRALAHSEQNARAIVEAGAVSRVCALVSQATPPVQSETVKFLCHLTSFEGLRPRLDRTELFETLIPFSLSPKEEVWICSAGAILHMIGAKDCFSIVSAWNAPTGGLRECFVRYLCSNHGTIQLLAIVVISKWLEGGDHAMKNLITGSPEIVARVNEIANDPEACAPVPMQHRRDATSEDPRVITMVSAGLIVEMLLATEE